MILPRAQVAERESVAARPIAGSSSPFQILKKRSDFLAVSRGRRKPMPGFVLQGRFRDDGDPSIRVGFTCSRKVGNAVRRNRAKRRLREAARLVLPVLGRPGWDYVLIGRAATTEALPFATLLADLETALGAVHGKTR